MIFLRTSGTDDNPAGASAFVDVPVPIGSADGDLALVGITVPSAGVSVAPPSTDWQLVTRSDVTQSVSVWIFALTVLNAPARWVFSLSASVEGVGTIAVYGGVDSFVRVEVAAAQATSSGATNVPAISASVDGEELVVFLGAGASGTFTPATGLAEVARSQQANATSELQRESLVSAQIIPAFAEAFSGATATAAAALVLRPGVGTLTVDDVRQRIVAGLPPGVDRVYDLEPGGDFFRFFQALAEVAKTFVFDIVDLVRLELEPGRSFYKLADWEAVLGLGQTRISQLGIVPQRQAQVIAAWRAAASQGSSIPEVQAAVAPLLGYASPSEVTVAEPDNASIDAAHSYQAGGVVLPALATTTITIAVADGGNVSSAGARLHLDFSTTTFAGFTVTLTAPGGATKTWLPPWQEAHVYLWGKELAGVPIAGNWILAVHNGSGSTQALGSDSVLIVEGIGPVGLGAERFVWGVIVDDSHLGEAGSADLEAAGQMVRRLAQAHTEVTGSGLLNTQPWPDTVAGPHAAIPDDCVPA